MSWSLALKNLFLPVFCKLCGERLLTEENGFFCPTCWDLSPRIARPFCNRCGRPHESMVGFGALTNFPCADCREQPNPHVNRVYGSAVYEGAVKEAVKLLKFHEKRRLAPLMAELMAEIVQAEMEPERYDFLVPVPLHKVRLRERGFNQSLLLAEAIAPLFPQAPLNTDLQRIRPTRVQSRLKGDARQANVRGAFAVAGDALQGKCVLLVDDVITTMGTITECAHALKRAGAREVDVLAVALATRKRDFEDV